jgi:hypothetical protein
MKLASRHGLSSPRKSAAWQVMVPNTKIKTYNQASMNPLVCVSVSNEKSRIMSENLFNFFIYIPSWGFCISPQVMNKRFCIPLFCSLCATSVNILSSLSLYCHYMFWPNRPSSEVQVVVMKEFAALLQM